ESLMGWLHLERRQSPSQTTDLEPLVGAAARAVGHAHEGPDERLAALGLRSLADLLAPASFVVGDDHMLLDGQHLRVLAVSDLPPMVAAGWLSGILVEHLPVTV